MCDVPCTSEHHDLPAFNDTGHMVRMSDHLVTIVLEPDPSMWPCHSVTGVCCCHGIPHRGVQMTGGGVVNFPAGQ